MIKFFRKIRYNLVETGKTGKYLKYAFGEIVLVMIGILLALQVNELNNEWNRKKTEQVIIDQLKNDLQTSQTQLESLIEHIDKRAAASAIICQAFWTNGIPNDTIFDYMVEPLSTRVYSPILGTARSLINSGDIALIESNKLKNQITLYVERVESRLKDINRYEETYYRNGVLSIRQIVPISFLSPRSELQKLLVKSNAPDFETSRNDTYSYRPNVIEKLPFEADLHMLFQDKRVYDSYSQLLIGHRNMSSRYKGILKITSELLKELEQVSTNRE